MLTPYAVAIFAMLFSAGSFLTLMYVINHFDPPESHSAERVGEKAAV